MGIIDTLIDIMVSILTALGVKGKPITPPAEDEEEPVTEPAPGTENLNLPVTTETGNLTGEQLDSFNLWYAQFIKVNGVNPDTISAIYMEDILKPSMRVVMKDGSVKYLVNPTYKPTPGVSCIIPDNIRDSPRVDIDYRVGTFDETRADLLKYPNWTHVGKVRGIENGNTDVYVYDGGLCNCRGEYLTGYTGNSKPVFQTNVTNPDYSKYPIPAGFGVNQTTGEIHYTGAGEHETINGSVAPAPIGYHYVFKPNERGVMVPTLVAGESPTASGTSNYRTTGCYTSCGGTYNPCTADMMAQNHECYAKEMMNTKYPGCTYVGWATIEGSRTYMFNVNSQPYFVKSHWSSGRGSYIIVIAPKETVKYVEGVRQ